MDQPVDVKLLCRQWVHAREEDTPEEHLRLGVEAFYRTVCHVIAQSPASAESGHMRAARAASAAGFIR